MSLRGREREYMIFTFWHKHRYCQQVDSSSVLPLLYPGIHILLLAASPSLFYDLGTVREKNAVLKEFSFLHLYILS